MSFDVSSYWSPCGRTPMGLLAFGPGEVQLHATSHERPDVDLEFGNDKATTQHQRGAVILTTHRIIWQKGEPAAATSSPAASAAQPVVPLALGMSLESVERVEHRASLLGGFGFGMAAPRIVLHLHDPAMVEYLRQQHALTAGRSAAASVAAAVVAASSSGATAAAAPPIKSSLPRFARLAFRGEAPSAFFTVLQSALSSGVFRSTPATTSSNVVAPEGGGQFKTTGAGISGIVRDARQRERALDRTLDTCFADLSALMSNARVIVDLASKLATSSRELEQADQRSEFDSMLSDMGIRNPVTLEMTGSAYHLQLAREMAEFLPTPVARHGGMLLLTDAYVLLNRARGTQLISPQDCATAAGLLQSLPGTTLRLHEFANTRVKVVLDTDADTAGTNVAHRIRRELDDEAAAKAARAKTLTPPTVYDPLRDAPSISPLQLSDRWHISIILARQYLAVAEQQQLLCRDESRHGLAFFANHFKLN